MKKKVSVSLERVTKQYVIRHEKPTLTDHIFQRSWSEEFKALDDVSTVFHPGERVGIVGDNGSGKTTLLKIIAGITAPTSGDVAVRGKVVSLIQLDAGFHSDLTGLENIYLNGLIVGMSRQEIQKKIKKIVQFSGIEKFIDAPLYTYSDGMKLRLGFSVAIHADPDILILDEGFMAGDAEFQNKIKKKVFEFFQKNKTVFIVSHWLDFLEKSCTRIIWMENGKVKVDGGKEVLLQRARHK